MGFLIQERKGVQHTMFKTVQRNLSLTERTEQQIEELIARQSLRAGERLPPQDKLAEQLGVSRTVIREAVRFLIAKGLIEARKGSGVYVRSSSALYSDQTSIKLAATHTGKIEPKRQRGRMLPEERRRRILEMLSQAESITVSNLVERLGISRVTARADLDSLSAEGLLVRSHGGALKPMDPRNDFPLQLKETLHHAEKVRIAVAAAKLIHDGDTVALDSGTTTCEIAKQIKNMNLSSLTVITNALNIANELTGLEWVSLIMTGGILRHKSASFTGPHAHETLRDLNADHLFLGADAIDVDGGLTTPDVLGAQVALRMIELAREVTAVVDASKFGRHSLTLSGRIDDLDRVITDSRVGSDRVNALRRRGIEVILV